uniref:Uncharacterized protein n=1 Tax=Clostridium botulinum TaxID=1491 RepID=A0A0A0UTF2_CLOBO|nr:hypothetical protein [Clostridium botulinum]
MWRNYILINLFDLYFLIPFYLSCYLYSKLFETNKYVQQSNLSSLAEAISIFK